MKLSELKNSLKKLPKIKEHDYHLYLGQAIELVGEQEEVYNCVVFVEQKSYLKHWEHLPTERILSLDKMTRVEYPPYCLPQKIAQAIIGKIEPIEDRYIYYLRLKNGECIQCQTDFMVSFVRLPEGYSVHDIDAVESLSRAKFHIKGLEYWWCFY